MARLEKNELVAYWRDTAEKDYQTMKHLYADYVTSHIRFYRPSLPRRIRWRGRLCKLGFAEYDAFTIVAELAGRWRLCVPLGNYPFRKTNS